MRTQLCDDLQLLPFFQTWPNVEVSFITEACYGVSALSIGWEYAVQRYSSRYQLYCYCISQLILGSSQYHFTVSPHNSSVGFYAALYLDVGGYSLSLFQVPYQVC